jgi:DNA-binding CsgD family transcriptional regulator
MLRSQDALLKLIATVHEGAASADIWVKALDLLSDQMKGSSLLLGTTPHMGGRFNLCGHRVDPGIVTLINGPLATREANPVFRAVPQNPVLRPVVISSRLADEKFLASQVYAEALKPAGVRHTMAVVLDADPVQAVTLALGRGASAGDYGAEEAKLLALLAPHFRSALTVRREFELARASAATLNSFDRAIMLVTEQGTVCFANEEAERILVARDGLESGPGGLRAARNAETATLRRMIVEAAHAGLGGSEGAGGAMAVSRPSLRMPYVVQVSPAGASTQACHGFAPQPMAALFVRDPECRARPPADSLKQLYGLTTAEAELALQIYDGLGLSEAADALGISTNTAKTHLKCVFEKVGVGRQSALVRELAIAIGDLGGRG